MTSSLTPPSFWEQGWLDNRLFFQISAFLSRLELIFSSEVRVDKKWKVS